MDEVRQFYDNLAATYRFIHADWQQSVMRHGTILTSLMESLDYPPPRTLLDCTCGIGTQAIGLAIQGFTVHGTDLSPAAIARAQEYATQFEIAGTLTFAVADLLNSPATLESYEIVLSCDNAVAHFHTRAHLTTALTNMIQQLQPGGLLLVSLRDYDAEVQDPKHATPVYVTDTDAGRRVVFQIWDWDDSHSAYHLQMFLIRQQKADWTMDVHTSHLRAWQRADIADALQEIGLLDIRWHLPETSGYYQPVVTARKP